MKTQRWIIGLLLLLLCVTIVVYLFYWKAPPSSLRRQLPTLEILVDGIYLQYNKYPKDETEFTAMLGQQPQKYLGTNVLWGLIKHNSDGSIANNDQEVSVYMITQTNSIFECVGIVKFIRGQAVQAYNNWLRVQSVDKWPNSEELTIEGWQPFAK